MVEAGALEAARALISRDDPRAAIVFEEATDDVLADPVVLPASFALLVPSRANQERALRAAAAATPTIEALVALAVLTGESFDSGRAREVLAAAAAKRRQRLPVARTVSCPSIWVAGISVAVRRRRHRARSPHRPASRARGRRPPRADVQRRPGDAAERRRSRLCRFTSTAIDVFADQTVVSFCNGEFLGKLPAIVAAGPPREVIWFNCMTWTFAAERSVHAEGLIDRFGFQSQYQRSMLLPLLERHRPGSIVRLSSLLQSPPRRVAISRLGWRLSRRTNLARRSGQVCRRHLGDVRSRRRAVESSQGDLHPRLRRRTRSARLARRLQAWPARSGRRTACRPRRSIEPSTR